LFRRILWLIPREDILFPDKVNEEPTGNYISPLYLFARCARNLNFPILLASIVAIIMKKR
jgi:hypothetical protein